MSETGERRGDAGEARGDAGARARQSGGELARHESRYPAVRPGGEQPPPPPGDDGWQRFSQWWGKPVTALAVLALLLLAVGFALALLIRGPGQTVVSGPTATATVTHTVPAPGPTITVTLLPGPSGTRSPDDNPPPTSGPEGRASLPPAPGSVAIHQTGQFNAIDVHRFDLDGNDLYPNDSASEDLIVTSNGVFTTNRAILTRFSGSGDPQLSDCAGIPFPNWRTSLLTKDIAADARYCVITTDDRYGFFTTHSKTTANRAGTDLDRVSFSFTVWSGAND